MFGSCPADFWRKISFGVLKILLYLLCTCYLRLYGHNWLEGVSQVNTALIMGAPKGKQGVTGGIWLICLRLALCKCQYMVFR